MRIRSFAGCVALGFALFLTAASDAQQQPTNAPQVGTEKQPNDGVKTKDGADSAQQATAPNATTIAQRAAENSETQREPNLSDTRNQGTEFWPLLFGYKIRITDGFLVLFTAALWVATWRLVAGADDSAKRELRAYVAAQAAGINRVTPNENLFFLVAIINGGKTPAYKMRQSGEVFIADYPLPINYQFPAERALSPPTTLFPNIPVYAPVVTIDRFTQAQLVEALQAPATGGRRLYACGRVHYVDAFGKKCWTKYCFSFTGFHAAIPVALAGDWNAVEAAIHAPNTGLGFEGATTHNDTEDG